MADGVAVSGRPELTDLAISLLKSFEGFRAKPYLDVAGHGTVGFGHLIRPDERDAYIGRELTRGEAETLLVSDFAKHLAEVETLTSGLGLMVHEREALGSLAFNVGVSRLRASTLLSHVKRGLRLEAAAEFLVWRKAGGAVQPGLVRRRHVESCWFLGAAAATLHYVLEA
jgi:lysozyme